MHAKFPALLLSALVGLSPVNAAAAGQMSSDTLHIQQMLSSYSEESLRAQLSEAGEDKIELARDGESAFQIVVADGCGEETLFAAGELSKYLNQLLGSSDQFPVLSESAYDGGAVITVGQTTLSQGMDLSEVRDDGYLIDAQKEQIHFLALTEEALSNAVYGFLEDTLGCMFVREDYDYVPSLPTIFLEPFHTVSNPDFAWRKVYQYEVAQNGWYRKLRNNGVEAGAIEKHAGWGTWCHTSFTFVSPDEYSESHPEFFTYNEAGEPQQLCLSQEAIYPIIEAKMAELMAEQPEKTYWDFSLNDNMNYCTCEKCQKVLEETGSMMGTMLPIINRLARRFPDKIISTLAYFYNEQPPKGMTCEPNVNIVLAPISTGQLYSYRYGATEAAAKAKALVESWGAVSSSLMIWDYVINFKHLLLPYPNYDVQADNHVLYLENNVRAVFHQGSREHDNEMARLRSYILSRQLWDNDTDVSAVLAKYVTVTYGDAAPYVAEYLDTMNRELKEHAENLDLYDAPESHSRDYLSRANIRQYEELINSAIAAVDDSRIIGYLEEIKLNVLYAVMYEPGLNYLRKQNAFEQFSALAEAQELKRHTEVGMEMPEFLAEEYPAYLRSVALKLSAACIVPPLVVGLGVGGFLLAKKKGLRLPRRKKKGS